MRGLEKYEGEAIAVMARELIAAKKKFPRFAEDLFQAVSLLGEEFGETSAAVNDHEWDGGSLDDVIREAGQNAAVAIRTICMALKLKEASRADA